MSSIFIPSTAAHSFEKAADDLDVRVDQLVEKLDIAKAIRILDSVSDMIEDGGLKLPKHLVDAIEEVLSPLPCSGNFGSFRGIQPPPAPPLPEPADEPYYAERRKLELREQGPVWSTEELRRDFSVVSFAAPFVHVIHKASGLHGQMEFQHSPRFYWGFEANA